MFKIIDKIFKQQQKRSFLQESRGPSKMAVLKELVKEGEKEANRKNFDKALELFDQAINIDPNYDCPYGDKGVILDIIGKHHESISMYTKALELNPSNPITWHNKGLVLVRLKKIEEAIICFDNAISYDEGYAKAWYNKGRCLELLGNTERAQSCLTKARKLDPFLFTKIKMKHN